MAGRVAEVLGAEKLILLTNTTGLLDKLLSLPAPRLRTVTPTALLERLAARGRPAVLGIRVRIDQVFFHCAKAFLRSNLWKPEKWGEPHRVSFGEIFAAKTGADDATARGYDEAVQKSYAEEL